MNASVCEAMASNWGSREKRFIDLTGDLRHRLVDIIHGEKTHVAVPLQGSGTHILEATIGTLITENHKLLVLVNGDYGRRMVKIAQRLGKAYSFLEWSGDQAVDPVSLASALEKDSSISHVALVHCETTTGVLNPLEEVARVTKAKGRELILDAMSSFGALEIDVRKIPVLAVLASGNKCLEGPPGVAFALIERHCLEHAENVSCSLSLDLYEQWRYFESTGQWRFTPPVQVVAGLVEALRQLENEGGPSARLARYEALKTEISEGLQSAHCRHYLAADLIVPIIVTFIPPEVSAEHLQEFYACLEAEGLVIYAGKVQGEDSFRVGCMGAITSSDVGRLCAAFRDFFGS